VSTNYEQAQAILNDAALANRMLYKEHLLEKASALATLALADAVKGAGEVREVEVTPDVVYAVVSRTSGSNEHWQTVQLFVEHEAALTSMYAYQTQAEHQGSGIEFSMKPERLVP
jgi:hypothetical protein